MARAVLEGLSLVGHHLKALLETAQAKIIHQKGKPGRKGGWDFYLCPIHPSVRVRVRKTGKISRLNIFENHYLIILGYWI